MPWFGVLCRFEIWDEDHVTLLELVLIQALNSGDAIAEATRKRTAEPISYINESGETIVWRFVSVEDCYPLAEPSPAHGSIVYVGRCPS